MAIVREGVVQLTIVSPAGIKYVFAQGMDYPDWALEIYNHPRLIDVDGDGYPAYPGPDIDPNAIVEE